MEHQVEEVKIKLTLWRLVAFGDFRKKTPNRTWLYTGLSPFLFELQTWCKSSSLHSKKNFCLGVRVFCEWRHKWKTFRPPWPTLHGPGPNR